MRRISAAILAFVFMYIFCATSVSAAEAEMLPSGTEYDKIGEEIESFVDGHTDNMAGMAVSVFNKDNVLYENYFGYANKEGKIQVDENTVFEWGSATKTLVWISVMQQVERGNIDLEKDISEYLPENFLTNSSFDNPVTMLNLMNHTAGYQELLVDVFVKNDESILPLGEQLKKYEPKQIYEPGTITAYSNWGVALAAYIVECVSGQDFCEYVHQNIFTPLGMKNTALAADLSDNEKVAEKRKELECYTADGKLIPDCFYYVTLYPAGMCTSTLDDMRIWAVALASKDTKILSSETWEEFYEPTSFYTGTETARNCHGLWTELRSSIVVGHGGNTAGCSSYIIVEPDSGIGAVVMTNQQNECVFNYDMIDLIFGKYDRTLYFDAAANPKGAYRAARTIMAGPFKLYGAGFVGDFQTAEGSPWNYVENSPEGTLVQESVTDFIQTPGYIVFVEGALIFGSLAVIALSLIILLVKFIFFIVYKAKGKKSSVTLGKWQNITCISVLLTTALFAYAILNAFAYEVYSEYIWSFYVIFVMSFIMLALFIYGIVGIFRQKSTKKCLFFNILMLLILAVILAFIVYFQLWRIWVI